MREIRGAETTLRVMLATARHDQQLSDALILPNLEKDRSFFYDPVTHQLRPAYHWYGEFLQNVPCRLRHAAAPVQKTHRANPRRTRAQPLNRTPAAKPPPMHTSPSSAFQTRLVFLAALAALLPGPVAVRAQTTSPSPTPTGVLTGLANFWRCQLPGGVYLVALRNIQSVSSHEYIVDGAARVTEVTVATASSVEARFYYLEPVGANAASPVAGAASTLQGLQQRVQDLATSHAPVEPVWEKVVKNYPTTTHAHTVEFRLTTLANLQQIEQSLEQAWISGKGVSLQSE